MEFRLLTFTAQDVAVDPYETGDCSDALAEGVRDEFSSKSFFVQMFGINSVGETVSMTVSGFKPFFYVKVPDSWKKSAGGDLVSALRIAIGASGKKSDMPIYYDFVHRKTLYGFDGGKQHSFIQLKFESEADMRAAKNCWYSKSPKRADSGNELRLMKEGFIVDMESTYLYEAQIPPLLRMFHIKKISPSGWISIKRSIKQPRTRSTTCKYEYQLSVNDITALPDKEEAVPYKICSFDIEASSSHGDFPLAKKDYKKLASNIVDIWTEYGGLDIDSANKMLADIIRQAFDMEVDTQHAWLTDVEYVYPISMSGIDIEDKINVWLSSLIPKTSGVLQDAVGAEADVNDGVANIDEVSNISGRSFRQTALGGKTLRYKGGDLVYDVLNGSDSYETKVLAIKTSLDKIFPRLKGDEVTFIGSTFMLNGQDKPYLNHCIVNGKCASLPNVELQFCKNEKNTLLAWADIIQREDPDIIIGYNIFGFDYSFMYDRCVELGCAKRFLMLSRNKPAGRYEICTSYNWKTKRTGLKESSIVIASGQHDLRYAEIPGRLQVDLYNYLRRDYQLTQYKLDYVAGHFIGDTVKTLQHNTETTPHTTCIESRNLVGLEENAYICFEEIAHSSEMYKGGKKFKVTQVDHDAGCFSIEGIEQPNMSKLVRWGLAKDDVTPQDIFRMTNGDNDSRATIAKYCVQDCNLVQQLFRKIDVLTGFIEMASLCSVPLEFLVMRGQGIKLTSYIAKKCQEKGTLMPVIPKAPSNEAYEGAIVLAPKCGLYLDTPVACVDYSSLYPSSMISENISHDTKVWSKEYDLSGKLIKETGIKKDGKFVYDNLNTYKYVDIEYDTYQWRKKATSSAMEKIVVGKKICRFAQFPNNSKGESQYGIMPSVLKELLAARKATRKQIATVTDPFMKNVLDKRQLSIKLTANSLYGGTGAKTSSFYEQDCAASTTAVGRRLLTYAKTLLEKSYSNRVVETCGEKVMTNAEYVYGDTDSVFFKFNLKTLDGVPIVGKKALRMTIDLAKGAGKLATSFLKPPHDLEYEKTFLPWCLLSKKRYVGMLYEDDPEKCKRKSMGIVLKRRDNAPIVKDVYGGVIDVLMKDQNVAKAITFMRESLAKLVAGEYGLEKLIITKSLRSHYKNPRQIAHKVLADRIGRREPGNKPRPGDRIAFAYFKNPARKALQGEKIETPTFIQSQGLKLNYEFYITNQLMKPLQQLFALVLEDLPGFKRRKGHTLRTWKKQLAALKAQCETEIQYIKKEEALRNKEVKILLFDEYIKRAEGHQDLRAFF